MLVCVMRADLVCKFRDVDDQHGRLQPQEQESYRVWLMRSEQQNIHRAEEASIPKWPFIEDVFSSK